MPSPCQPLSGGARTGMGCGRRSRPTTRPDAPSPSITLPPTQPFPTAAGDSAAYERRASALDDVVIVSALRTPITKAKRGGLKDTAPDDLLLAVLSATLQRTGINPADIGDIVIGSVLGDSSQRAIQCRIASLLAGIPDTVPIHTVNRQCSSGLQAIASVAAAIKAGYYTMGLAGGVESMSTNPMAWEGGVNPKVAENESAQNCLLPMGE